MNIEPKAAKLLYELGLIYEKLDFLRDTYGKDNRPEQIQLTIDLFKVKIEKLRRQISELD